MSRQKIDFTKVPLAKFDTSGRCTATDGDRVMSARWTGDEPHAEVSPEDRNMLLIVFIVVLAFVAFVFATAWYDAEFGDGTFSDATESPSPNTVIEEAPEPN